MNQKNKIHFRFGTNFEEKFLGNVIKHPEITLIELVANSWDALATEVHIQWPNMEFTEKNSFSVKDNGSGMTTDEFKNYWSQLGFDKREFTNSEVILENGVSRKVLGRNGKGRLGLFGFSSEYKVITCKNNEKSIFTIKKNSYSNEYADIILENVEETENNGTYIECPIYDNYIPLETLKTELAIRFGADPNFNVFINGEELSLLDFSDSNCNEYDFKNNKIKIFCIKRDTYNKKLSQYQIVWFVNQRAAEINTWKELGIPLEGNNKNENKFAFCIQADFLEKYIKSDWTGFIDDPFVTEIKSFVKDKILNLTYSARKNTHVSKKIKALSNSKEDIKKLNPISKMEIGSYVDEILDKCPSLNEDDLSNVVQVLTKMEISNRKYDLFDYLSKVDPDDIEKLTEIFDNWSIKDTYIVLNELYDRLKTIEKLEEFGNNPLANELHMIHPLFENNLWIFGPEYEGIGNFSSNKSLKNTLKKVLNIETDFEESNLRPDIVTNANQDIFGIYGSDEYNEGNVIGYKKVLIIELKKGGSTISYDAMNQVRKYSKKIRKSGNLQMFTKIDCFVIGSKVDEENQEIETVGDEIKIYPTTFDTVIRNAKNRTLNIKDKLKRVKGINQMGDPEINKMLEEKTLEDYN